MDTALTALRGIYRTVKAPEHGLDGSRARDMVVSKASSAGANARIYAYDEDHMALMAFPKMNLLRDKLKALPWVRFRSEGHMEFVAIFPDDRIHEIARIVKARKKRVLSEEQRARVIATTAAFRFPSKTHGRQVPTWGSRIDAVTSPHHRDENTEQTSKTGPL